MTSIAFFICGEIKDIVLEVKVVLSTNTHKMKINVATLL
jgi:hypothetical protein